MTERISRPTTELEAVERDFRWFLAEVGALTDEQARGPSSLPGWTRGHLLTHVARSGEGDARTVEGALRDEVVDKYPGGVEGRERDIEAGAGRGAAELVADLAATQERLTRAWASMPDDAWGRIGNTPMGPRSAADGVRARRREILVHLVDLDIGVNPGDLPSDYRESDADWLRQYRGADWVHGE